LGVISFLFSANSPVLANNLPGLGNLARAQSVYYENTPLPKWMSGFAYLAGGILIVASIVALIYMVFYMNRRKDENL
jgi:hypothetical protein